MEHLDTFMTKNVKKQLIGLIVIFIVNTIMAIVFTIANKSLVTENLYNIIVSLRCINLSIQILALLGLIYEKRALAHISILLCLSISLTIVTIFPSSNNLIALISVSITLVLIQLILSTWYENRKVTLTLGIGTVLYLNIYAALEPTHPNISEYVNATLYFSILISLNYLLIMISLFNIALMMSINRATGFIKNLLYIDLKTGLYNERQFEHVLSKAISDQNKLIVLAIDLSNLQELNHHFGYRTIHKLYIEELARIQSLMIPFGSTYKLDGPVLAYIIHSDQNALIDSKTNLLEIINQLESTKLYENQEIHFKYQILATQYPQDGTYPSQLIDNLYHLKYSNSPSINSIRWYDQRSFDQLKRRIRLEKDLEQAIQSGDIYIVIQPQVTLKDYKVHGAEILARWHHPEYGEISPNEFIPIAEQMYLIDLLTEHIVKEASVIHNQIAEINPDFKFQLAVNISALSLNGKLDKSFKNLPHPFEIEITESTLISLTENAKQTLSYLKSKGFTIAIDDFGTGFSNLEYLHALDVDVLKIDKRFVDSMMNNDKALKLVEALIIMAHTLGFNVVAEGVETKMQCDVLAVFDCDIIQGYWFAKPMLPNQFITFFKNANDL